jgi:hypothetical protein
MKLWFTKENIKTDNLTLNSKKKIWERKRKKRFVFDPIQMEKYEKMSSTWTIDSAMKISYSEEWNLFFDHVDVSRDWKDLSTNFHKWNIVYWYLPTTNWVSKENIKLISSGF